MRLLSLIRTAGTLALLAGAAGCDRGKDDSDLSSEGDKAQQARVVRARELLAQAGYPGGKGFPRLEILYNTSEAHKKIAAAVQFMWRKHLGIDVQLRNAEWKVYLDDMSKVRYQIMRRGWIGDYCDPYTFIEMFTSRSGNNNTDWENEEYDRLVKAARAEPDARKRLDLLRQAETILMREVPVMPLYFYVSSNCWKDHVKGVYANILDLHPLNEAYAEGREVLVINNDTEVQSLDPGLARGVPEHRILIALFEGLITYDPRTLEPRPAVAERWEISPDRKTYTFHLRECAWSDGRKVTAHDFEYAWKRVLDPATPTDYAHQLHYLKGAEAYNTRKTSDPATVGVRARDERTLVVELENPCAFFLHLCGFFTYYPVRKDILEKHGEDWTRPQHMVSNGPFLLKERVIRDYTLVEKNPRYWNAAKVRQSQVKFLPIENRSTAWGLYKDGGCDWVTSLPPELVDEIIKRPDYRGDEYLGTYFYSFNVREGPLQDRRIRLALTLAVDREIIVSKIVKQGQKAAYHLTPPAWPEYKSPRFDEIED